MAICRQQMQRVPALGAPGVGDFAALDHEGGMVAATYDLATHATRRIRLAQFEDDDHNNPALLTVSGKPLVCFYSRHDAEEGLRYRISTRPLSLDDWLPEQRLEFGGPTTYAQVHDAGAACLLPGGHDGARVARDDGGIQPADVNTHLQGVGSDDAAQLARVEGVFDLLPFLG